MESPTQIDPILLKILDCYLNQNDTVARKFIETNGFFNNSIIKVLTFCGVKM